MAGPAMIEAREHAVRRRARATRADPRSDLRMVNRRDVLVELAVQHQDASGYVRPCALDIGGGKLAEEPFRTARIWRRRTAQRPVDHDPADPALVGDDGGKHTTQ